MDYDASKTKLGESVSLGCEPARLMGLSIFHDVLSYMTEPGKLTISTRYYDITVACKCGKEKCDALG